MKYQRHHDADFSLHTQMREGWVHSWIRITCSLMQESSGKILQALIHRQIFKGFWRCLFLDISKLNISQIENGEFKAYLFSFLCVCFVLYPLANRAYSWFCVQGSFLTESVWDHIWCWVLNLNQVCARKVPYPLNLLSFWNFSLNL